MGRGDKEKGAVDSEAIAELPDNEGASSKRVELSPVPFTALFRFADSLDRGLMVMGLFCAALAGAAFPLTTVVFGQLIDTFGKWEAQPMPGVLISAETLTAIVSENTVYFLYLALGTFILTYLYMSSFVYTAERQTHRIRQRYLAAVLRQNIGWFDHEGAGEVSVRITTDTLLIQDAIGDKVPLALNQLAVFISGFVIAFTKSWKLTLVLLSVIPLIVASAAVMNVINGRFQRKILDLYSTAGTLTEEAIAAIRTVTAFGSQRKMARLYNESLAGARNEGIKKATTTGLGLGALFFFVYVFFFFIQTAERLPELNRYCAYSLCFYFGAILLKSNEITPGVVVNVFFAVLIGAFALGQIAPDLQAFSFGRGAGAKIFYTIDRVPEIDSYSETGKHLSTEKAQGRVELKNVSFFYPARPEVLVLDQVSLTIEAGSTVALVGQSGSGKSTIIQLMEHFYDPTSGVIEIDGINMTDLNVLSLRQHIGFVSQEPTLFEGTVAQNVMHGLIGSAWETDSFEKRMEKLKEACQKANAHDFILKLPYGYDTPVGERGSLLSGGQKQRICIARAIVKDPKILLLDEATSALDTASERIVQDALDRASQGRTTLVIAHRLSTIINADKIVVMIRGKIIESGTHESLVAQPDSFYGKLVEAQKLAAAKGKKLVTADVDPDEVKFDAQEEAKIIKSPTSPTLSLGQLSIHSARSGTDLEASGKEQNYSTWRVVREIVKLNNPELKYTIPGLLAAIVSGMVYPMFAIVFGSIIQVFSETGDKLTTDSNFWAIMFVVIAIATFVSSFAQNALFGYSSEYLTERIRKDVFDTILRQDIAFFDDERNATGILTSNLSTDAQRIQGISGVTIGTIFQVSTNLVGGVIVALIYGWKLALVATAALPILIGAGYWRLKIITYFSDMNKVTYERSAQLACEAVAGIRTVQSLTREKDVLSIYMKMLEEPLRRGVASAWTNTSLYAFSQCVNFLINALVFWYGGQLIAYEDYELKSFFTVFVAIIFGSMGAGRIFAVAPDFSQAVEAGRSILRLLSLKPLIDSWSEEGSKLDKVEGEIEFKDVRFSYPTRPHIKVLQGLSLTVKPGQFAALVGSSGCGKSTTVGLLERFYSPTGGKIMLDGKNIADINLGSYRSVVGLVAQEPNLFDLSIRENITLGCKDLPSQEVIENACKEANIHDFIITLPKGYDTNLGGKGSQLSGGQKQRIAIARALIGNPKILLLDEATSALDAESEKVVQLALDKAAKGRTTLAIAHRLSSIQNADVIFVFEEGVVVEQGTHQELLAKKGLYSELVAHQDLSGKE